MQKSFKIEPKLKFSSDKSFKKIRTNEQFSNFIIAQLIELTKSNKVSYYLLKNKITFFFS